MDIQKKTDSLNYQKTKGLISEEEYQGKLEMLKIDSQIEEDTHHKKLQNNKTFGFYKYVLTKKFMDFNGRASREEYWYFTLANFIIGLILSFTDFIFLLLNFPLPLSDFYELIILIPSLAVTFRRLHDVGYSGWLITTPLIVLIAGMLTYFPSLTIDKIFDGFYIIFFIIILYSAFVLYLLLKRGDKGKNRYGTYPAYLQLKSAKNKNEK